jgi:hypothetical protein
MHHSLKRGHTIDGLADSVDIFLRAGEEPLRTGSIDAVDRSSWFTIFLNSTATVVVACCGGRVPPPWSRPTPPSPVPNLAGDNKPAYVTTIALWLMAAVTERASWPVCARVGEQLLAG